MLIWLQTTINLNWWQSLLAAAGPILIGIGAILAANGRRRDEELQENLKNLRERYAKLEQDSNITKQIKEERINSLEITIENLNGYIAEVDALLSEKRKNILKKKEQINEDYEVPPEKKPHRKI